ncbi:MAG TPA: PfkB family carbohydrate kinase [Candidatus Limiplasma sp.]|nr:PfkB family carbohydrate kinase [Candidatus Limiplasma sp.]
MAIVAAIPEVSIESRVEMLRRGYEKGAYCVASVPEAEADAFLERGVFRYTNLVALNEREAAAIAPGEGDESALVHRLYEKLYTLNHHISLIVTAGKNGAYTADQGQVEYVPNLPVSAVNTAGAGDAFLGGTLAGLCMGHCLQKGRSDKSFGNTALESAAELGALCAGMSVESADSIAYNVDKAGIMQRIQSMGLQMTDAFSKGLA